jgi:predicted 3-demethylubiquinone-9 3-methyltransferase (glyoxalase superfamily)
MAKTIAPFLMFQDKSAEAAMRFYVSLFRGAEILELHLYGKGDPGPEGTVKLARFRIAGLTVLCSDSHVKHAFSFTPASSLFVECESEEELERLHSAFADGGATLMPPDAYGFSRRFAWVNDRFGVSWQLNVA